MCGECVSSMVTIGNSLRSLWHSNVMRVLGVLCVEHGKYIVSDCKNIIRICMGGEVVFYLNMSIHLVHRRYRPILPTSTMGYGKHSKRTVVDFAMTKISCTGSNVLESQAHSMNSSMLRQYKDFKIHPLENCCAQIVMIYL